MSGCCWDGTCDAHEGTLQELQERLTQAFEEMAPDGMYGSMSENGAFLTNMKPGGWVKQRDGSLISVERAKEMNRAQRRRLGITL